MSPVSRRQFLRDGAAFLAVGSLATACSGSPGESSPASLPVTTAAPPTPPAAVPSGAVADLRRRLKGSVHAPGEPGYDSAGLPANGRYLATRPAVIAQCMDESDVVTCVKWATENGVPPVGRGGGHNYAGLSTTTGLLIDIGRLHRVTVDRASGVGVVEGAALNQHVYEATADGPFVLPGGTCLSVGTGGLVLGGGIGYNAHWAGLTCDHLVSSRIVVASGDVLEIDSTDDADLYWACRGGAGGNFGINTSLTFQLAEVPSDTVYFRYDFRGADAATGLLDQFGKVCATAPGGFNASAMAQATPVGSGGPREAIDAFVRGMYIGSVDELQDLVAPILAATGAPAKMTVEPTPFWQIQRVWMSPAPAPHSFGDLSRYVREPVPESAYTKVVDVLAACPSRDADANGAVWSLGWVGGPVMSSVGRTDTAYVHRGMSTLLRPTPDWPNDAPASVGNDLLAWTDEVIAAIAPHTPPESYQNFPNRRLPDPLGQYYAENLDRLVDVKTRYDPANLFHNDQSIPVR